MSDPQDFSRPVSYEALPPALLGSEDDPGIRVFQASWSGDQTLTAEATNSFATAWTVDTEMEGVTLTQEGGAATLAGLPNGLYMMRVGISLTGSGSATAAFGKTGAASFGEVGTVRPSSGSALYVIGEVMPLIVTGEHTITPQVDVAAGATLHTDYAAMDIVRLA